jgi:hypothetical protein
MGLTNGCFDQMIEVEHYPEMAVNNTFGFQAYNQSVYESVANEAVPNCKKEITECRQLAAIGDPDYNGKNETVNAVCSKAFADCFISTQQPFIEISGVRFHFPSF